MPYTIFTLYTSPTSHSPIHSSVKLYNPIILLLNFPLSTMIGLSHLYTRSRVQGTYTPLCIHVPPNITTAAAAGSRILIDSAPRTWYLRRQYAITALGLLVQRGFSVITWYLWELLLRDVLLFRNVSFILSINWPLVDTSSMPESCTFPSRLLAFYVDKS